MPIESQLPVLAVPLLGLAWWLGNGARRHWVLPLLIQALSLVAVGLGLRWLRLGHGPFFNLYEILASSLFSLTLVYALFLWRRPAMWASQRVVLPILMLLGLWLGYSEPVDSHFHPTYDTPWLWVHLLSGKLFLGLTLCALGVALLPPLRRLLPRAFRDAPDDRSLGRQAWSLLRWALAWETAMLVAGSAWAQDAWGRYWAWDPLETWAFMTWLALVAALHLRQRGRVTSGMTAAMVAGVFVLAFLTFFGVPFLSVAPHKGAI